MIQTNSTMLPLNTSAPAFELPDINGKKVRLDDFKNHSVLCLMFICNHCPFVIHLQTALNQCVAEFQGKSVAFVAINSNDPTSHPEDSPEKMKTEAERLNYTFPYLFDATQQVAKDYHAACTPDFYVFDAKRKLSYRGRFDATRPNQAQPTGDELKAAIEATLKGEPPAEPQHPSMGCNIKWAAGNEPDYFG